MTDVFISISIVFLAIATVVNTVNMVLLAKSVKRLREQQDEHALAITTGRHTPPPSEVFRGD